MRPSLSLGRCLMLEPPIKDGIEIPTFVLNIEIWPRRGPNRNPVVGEDFKVAVAHDHLPKNLEAVIFSQKK